MEEKKEWTQDTEIFFDFDKSILICGTATFKVPDHKSRVYISKNERNLKTEEDPYKAAEFFYPLIEEYLRGVDIKVYQLKKGYKLADYQKSQDGLELLKHITNHEDIPYYEFATEFCNRCIQVFGGVKLGKRLKKS